MHLLVLGGTNDALRLAESLHQQGVSIVYSLAGLVRTPRVEFSVMTGGFSQYGGLKRYIEEYAITGIVDATHPYAKAMSDSAYEIAATSCIPYWQYDRASWEEHPDDKWFEYSDWHELWPMLDDKKSIFITTGQLDASTLDALSNKLSAKVLLRTAVKPTMCEKNLDEKIRWIQAIGPFTLADEITVMREYEIDALVSKNSGGDATIAKLHAARKLQIPVYLLSRPEYQRFQNNQINGSSNCSVKLNEQRFFSNLAMCEADILAYFRQAHT